MRRRSLLLLSTVAIIANAFPAFAEDIEAVVVTATRTEQPLAKTGESESVLTGSTLQDLQTVRLTDALALTPGITVDEAGGLGQPTAISIRGAETGQTVVLIDGVRINDPSSTDDGAILGDVLANNVDRVEILRGPQSTLYGSDAIGGVVNIITKRGGASPFGLTASAEGGSFDTYHFNAAANGTVADVDYGLSANYIHSNGISAADSRNGNPETDGDGNLGFAGSARWHIADSISVDVRSYYTAARDDFDDNYPPPNYTVADSAAYNTNRLFAGYAGINADFFDGMFQNRLAIISTHSARAFYDSSSDDIHLNYDYAGNTTRFEYQGVVNIDPLSQITFGAETQTNSFRNDNFGANLYFSPPKQGGRDHISGYYLQAQKTFFDALTLTGGVRFDDHSTFGSHTSVKAAAAYDFGEGTVLHANYGTGFKAPSLYQLYSIYQNPVQTLSPETARGWEAGVDQTVLDGRLRGSLTYFERNTRNMIGFQSCFVSAPPPACSDPETSFAGGYYYNVGRTRARGVETEVAATITETITISANYTYLDAKDQISGLALTRRPRNTFSATANWTPASNWGLGASLNSVSSEVDQYSGLTPINNGGHTTVNVFGHYDFDQWSIYARVENLFDARYEPLLGYGAPARAVYMGVRLSE
jgi:vitamin B12 transporter